MIFKYTVRRFFRHLPLKLLAFLVMTIGTAFLAILPSYAEVIAGKHLSETLELANPAARNIEITTYANTLNAAMKGDVREIISDEIFKKTVSAKAQTFDLSPVDPKSLARIGLLSSQSLNQLTETILWSFEPITILGLNLLEGRMPENQVSNNPLHSPPIEAAIGFEASELTGLGVGNRLTTTSGIVIEIVGIIAPGQDDEDAWWGNAASPFALHITSISSDVDRYTLPLVIDVLTMRETFATGPSYYRIIVDHQAINVNNAAQVSQSIQRMQGIIRNYSSRATILTGLPLIIERYEENKSTLQQTMLLLSSQAFIFILYLVALIASYHIQQASGEIATLHSRGASQFQIILIHTLEGIILMLPSIALGPPISFLALKIWALIDGTTVPVIIPKLSWYLSLGAGLAGSIAFLFPAISASQQGLIQQASFKSRPTHKSRPQKYLVDVFLLSLGALTVWQLSNKGSFLITSSGGYTGIDPILMIGPSVLLLTAALLITRLFPLLLQILSRATRYTPGLNLHIGFTRLARSPASQSQVILLMSMAVALLFFARTFEHTLHAKQEEIASYSTGANIKLSNTQAPADLEEHYPEIQALTAVLNRQVNISGINKIVTLIGIDPDTFADVSEYPPSASPVPITAITDALKTGNTSNPQTSIPLIYSNSILPKGIETGDIQSIRMFGRYLEFKVKGYINDFPSLPNNFIIVNLPALAQQVDLDQPYIAYSLEQWLKLAPDQYDEFIQHPEISEALIGDAVEQLYLLQTDTLSHGAILAFEMNATILFLLSGLAFLLVNYFSARERTFEYGVLRSLGTSGRQVFLFVMLESLLTILFGMGIGTVIGLGLSQLTPTFFQSAISQALTGSTKVMQWINFPQIAIAQTIPVDATVLHKILINWNEIGLTYGIVFTAYMLAGFFLLFVLFQLGVHQILRTGDE